MSNEQTPKEMMLIDASALRQVLIALTGPSHLIRELQATRSLDNLSVEEDKKFQNPINILLEDYNTHVESQKNKPAKDPLLEMLEEKGKNPLDVIRTAYQHACVLHYRGTISEWVDQIPFNVPYPLDKFPSSMSQDIVNSFAYFAATDSGSVLDLINAAMKAQCKVDAMFTSHPYVLTVQDAVEAGYRLARYQIDPILIHLQARQSMLNLRNLYATVHD